MRDSPDILAAVGQNLIDLGEILGAKPQLGDSRVFQHLLS
jgi:hypothetical protein